MTRLLHSGAIAALLVASLVLAGCGGGGAGDTTPVKPPVTTGTLSGRVVHSDDLTIPLGGAVVNVIGAGGATIATGTTNSDGAFTVLRVPVGTWTVNVETPNESDYGSQSVPSLIVTKNATTQVVVPVLRAVDASPTAIYLSPGEATVDIGGRVDFNAKVVAGSGQLPATPVFMVSSSVGQISVDGTFHGLRVGTANIIAICGNLTTTAKVTVVPSRSPEITSFLVAPLSLPASGGQVFVTASANDGDGLAAMQVEIYKPNGDLEIASMTYNSASTDTYQLFTDTGTGPVLGYKAPANSNKYDNLGHQAAQKYSIRVVATDGSGAITRTGFMDVSVAGLDAPPPGP